MMLYAIYTDGSCQPQSPGEHAGSGFIVYDQLNLRKPPITEYSSCNGYGTANESEYNAVIAALNWAQAQLTNIKQVHILIYSDSNLVIGQLFGRFHCKAENLLRKRNKALELIYDIKHHNFSTVQGIWIDRRVNVAADYLSRKTFETLCCKGACPSQGQATPEGE